VNTQWSGHYAARVQGPRNDAIKQILRLTQRPEVISFAGGLPAAELFPRDRVAEATQKLLAGDQALAALQYGIPEGYVPLRQMIADEMRALGASVTPDNILITSGSQQSLDLIGKVLINPGDRIVVEQPTYLGMLQAWRLYGAQYVTVVTDDCGIVPDALESALQSGPSKLIYLVPNFQNPTGVT
jgi:2-aminoadipate transaminase